MRSLADLKQELVRDLLGIYVKYQQQGVPVSMILGTIDELKTRLLVERYLKSRDAHTGPGNGREEPVGFEIRV